LKLTRATLRPASLAFAALCALGMLLCAVSRGSLENEVGVYEVSFYRTNEVLVHMNSAPGMSNILQYSNSFTNGTRWTNLFVAPILPFTNHYVIVDTRTAPQRFYRLLITKP
jgi:hypothetical protein